ncbi:MAG: patatin-like phospholipase family protein [Anaerolineaceae bacterium]|nr:patatin-like phospholipase family protein [Anaerolineaceae bacterium]
MIYTENKLKLGVVLSGGGARGLAHIGVLKALSSAGIQIDFLAGASMGGVIAATYAAGLAPSKIEEIACYVGTTSKLARLADPALPRKGLLKGKKIHDFFDHQLHSKTFDDLQIPLTLIAVDLNSSSEIHITKGSIADALRATISIPGVFIPVEKDGMRLVDGGLLNNLPIDVVRDMGADVVLAVDVGWHGSGKERWRESNQALISHTPLGELILTLLESMDVLLTQQVEHTIQSEKPDFLLQPQVPSVITSLTGYTHASELIAIGEEVTQPILADLRLSLHQANDST